MADFETKLRWLSERGNPVGAEELIERIEADLAGDPLVVVAKRREGTFMTKTHQPPATAQPSRTKGPAWALAALVGVIVVGGIYLASSGDDGLVAEPPMSDLGIIEAGVAAFYSGDWERAAELFELPDHDDDAIRGEAAYEAVIGGRLTLDCSESTPGTFNCRTPYHNAMTDAVGYVDGGDTSRVVVEDGVITEFAFPEHSFLQASVLEFLESNLDSVPACESRFDVHTAGCANLMLEYLDEWAAWYGATADEPIRLTQEDYEPIEPGTYFVDADGDPSTSAGATFHIESQGWIGSKQGVNFNSEPGVSAHTLHLKLFVEPFTPVCGQGPVDAGEPLAAGSTAADLADGFAASGFTVLEPPAPVTAFGLDGYHVVVQVPEGCQFGGERTPHIWIYPDDVIEVWSFDLDGSIAMVEALWLTAAPGIAPEEDPRLAELRAVIDTLVLTP